MRPAQGTDDGSRKVCGCLPQLQKCAANVCMHGYAPCSTIFSNRSCDFDEIGQLAVWLGNHFPSQPSNFTGTEARAEAELDDNYVSVWGALGLGRSCGAHTPKRVALRPAPARGLNGS